MARAPVVGDKVLWQSDQKLPVSANVAFIRSTGNVDLVVFDVRSPANLTVLNVAQDTSTTPAANTWNFFPSSGFGVVVPTTPAGSTTGGTANGGAGKFVLNATGTSYTLTNSFITTSSIVLVTQQTADTTATFIKSVVVTAGQAVITPNAAPTGAVTYGFMVIN